MLTGQEGVARPPAACHARPAGANRSVESAVLKFLPHSWSANASGEVAMDDGLSGAGASPGPDLGLDADWAAVDARSREALWVRQLYTGLVGFLGGGGAGLFYVLNTWGSRPHRPLLAAIATFAIVQSIVVWSLRGRFATPRQRTVLFVTWNLATCVIVAVASALDGGIESPVALMWVLPVIYMLMGYSRGAILICGAIAIGLYLVVAALTPGGAQPSTVVMQLATLATALFMVFLGATAREERERILQGLRAGLVRLAALDDLTGCINVRAFSRFESAEVTRAARYRHDVSLLAVDVDRFKAINDSRGHPVGDQVLRAVAAALRATARKTDVIGRLGGDEFAILCPETSAQAAAELAARLVTAVRALEVDGVTVTLSAGVCTLQPGSGLSRALRRHADAALYEAKRRGRDQYAVYASP
jgi:diguanylate cyclase (GGDEF)-like protein